jgi:hypothetical protein
VWTVFDNINPQAKLMMAEQLMSVFSQYMATRLNRLRLPIACSMRARSLYRRLGKSGYAALSFCVVRLLA